MWLRGLVEQGAVSPVVALAPQRMFRQPCPQSAKQARLSLVPGLLSVELKVGGAADFADKVLWSI